MLRHGGHGHRSQCFANTDTDAGGHSDAHRYVNTDGHRYANTDANANPYPPGPVLAQFHYSGRLRRA
jgi:hypothetical protein